ncbi:MAG: condensation domain-containing protein, partial [Xenococcaceae cyanobacterium]
MKKIDELLFEIRKQDVKLWVEGDRLRYKAPKDVLTPELLNEVKERKAEIISFLRHANSSVDTQLTSIQPIERNDNLPLSFAQQRLWLLHQFEPDSSSNNVPVAVKLTGKLNIKILEKSLTELVRRHEVLRTIFPSQNGQPKLVITPAFAFKLSPIDLRHLTVEDRDKEAFRLANQEACQPFDLAKEILRVKLFCLQDDEHLLVWNMHCIVCDGASSDVFYQDLTAIYAAFSLGKPSPLP